MLCSKQHGSAGLQAGVLCEASGILYIGWGSLNSKAAQSAHALALLVWCGKHIESSL